MRSGGRESNQSGLGRIFGEGAEGGNVEESEKFHQEIGPGTHQRRYYGINALEYVAGKPSKEQSNASYGSKTNRSWTRKERRFFCKGLV